MSSTPPLRVPVRSAEAVNEEIRALMAETGTWLWGPTRERYERLRDEWVEAVRGEMTTAA
jgi:polyhydroxyalkanoate synthesis regulator phasin